MPAGKGCGLCWYTSTCPLLLGAQEVAEAPGPHMREIDEHTPNSKVYRNYAGQVGASSGGSG
jgi:hypothetical protein